MALPAKVNWVTFDVYGTLIDWEAGINAAFQAESQRDGFTLEDLVSYNEKHNEANGENNEDGESYNRSWNCGVEGPTDDADVLALRARQKRNLLATLFLSQGVPLLLGGDEMGRTQGGNNNAYCQDNEISWFDWGLAEKNQHLVSFVAWLAELRRDHPVFRHRRWFQGSAGTDPHGLDPAGADIAWFSPSGGTMTDSDWHDEDCRAVGVVLNGGGIQTHGSMGERVVDDSFLMLFNAGADDTEFTIPGAAWAMRWRRLLDTSQAEPEGDDGPGFGPGEAVPLRGRSVVLLRRVH